MAKATTCSPTPITIGCDLGDKRSAVYVLRADDSGEQHRVPTNRVAMERLFQKWPGSHVVLEVGTHSRWVTSLLRSGGHRVTLANPRQLGLITKSESKSDVRDAEMLARLGRADLKLLAPVEHRDERSQAELAVIKARDIAVGTRTKLINHIRGVAKSFGERLPKCTAESFHRKTLFLIPTGLRPALEPLYATLEALHAQIRRLEQTIANLTKQAPELVALCQVDGVGELTALAFMRTLGDKSRFRKSRVAGAFLGLRPRRNQSGDDDPQLRITKAGDGFVRKLLVVAANYILGPFGKDSDLRRWGLKLAERGGKNGRKRAKVAVARKLAVLLHRLWVTGEVYQPLGYGTMNKAA
jgi:transposase